MSGIEKEKALRQRMLRLGVREEDIEEKFIRSQGPGGQNVNKVSTCVYLRHLPTGIEVKCQKERFQAENRFLARQILLDKIESRVAREISEERKRFEKMRRQTRARPRRLKLKILESKRRHSAKKALRLKVRETEN